jgi:peptidoglycan/LPS O-acetylase OafA/YrhL
MPVCVVLCLAALVVRYRRAGRVERQQMKWLLVATALFAAAYIPVFLFTDFDFGPDAVFWSYLWMVAMLLIPVAIGIAILRYRLYDIDVIIRKALLYAVLTALLALVYFGSIALIQGIVTAVSGQSSSVVIVLSTLAIAALFAPLRRRIQDVIDRRFFRKKYDAQRVLAQFAVTARDETDLDTLTAELARVVQETLQPEHVSVWLREDNRRHESA